MEKFAFMLHPLTIEDMRHVSPLLKLIPGSLLEMALKQKKPFKVSHITGVKSDYAEAEGWFVGCPLTARQMLELPEEFVMDRIIETGRIAEELGAKIVGLGAFTSIVGDAGLTVAESMISAAMARLSELIRPELQGRSGVNDLRISGLIEPAAATPELMEMIEQAGPFGQAAPAPRYALADLILDSAATMGDGHLRTAFRVAGQKPLEAVAWGAMQGPLGPALLGARGRRFNIAGKLELSHWGGRARVRLRLDDASAL